MYGYNTKHIKQIGKVKYKKGEQSDGKKICRNKQKEHDVLLLYDVDDGYSLLIMHIMLPEIR